MNYSDFAQEWIHAWNSHDLDEIMAHYDKDIDFRSPFIAKMGIDPEGKIRGKDALSAYFRIALEKYPDLHFEHYLTLEGPGSVVLYYKSVLNASAAEYMELNEQGLVTKVRAHYHFPA